MVQMVEEDGCWGDLRRMVVGTSWVWRWRNIVFFDGAAASMDDDGSAYGSTFGGGDGENFDSCRWICGYDGGPPLPSVGSQRRCTPKKNTVPLSHPFLKGNGTWQWALARTIGRVANS